MVYTENKIITFNQKPVTHVGRKIKQNMIAPYFRVTDGKKEEELLHGFSDKIKLITSFPVYEKSEFELLLLRLDKDIYNNNVIINISKDLPFAKDKFSFLNSINKILFYSDYKYSSFGVNYGLLIKELHLLVKAAIIIDHKNVRRYIQIVGDASDELNYSEVMSNLYDVFDNPVTEAPLPLSLDCKYGKEDIIALSEKTIEELLIKNSKWELIGKKMLKRKFVFKDFTEAKFFLDLISIIVEDQCHYPVMHLKSNELIVELTTGKAGGLTQNDFIMARIIDQL